MHAHKLHTRDVILTVPAKALYLKASSHKTKMTREQKKKKINEHMQMTF